MLSIVVKTNVKKCVWWMPHNNPRLKSNFFFWKSCSELSNMFSAEYFSAPETFINIKFEAVVLSH